MDAEARLSKASPIMNFEEHAAKPLLRAAGLVTPQGALASTPAEAARIADKIGPCVLKAQVPTGKRGKAGGIKLASNAAEAEAAASSILGMSIGSHCVEKVLVEAQVPIARELYAAVLNDPASKGPLLLFSARGGMDIEEIAAAHPDDLTRLPIDIRKGVDAHLLKTALPQKLPCDRDKLADVLVRLYAVYAGNDAELVEINPLVVTENGGLVALDCKLSVDDGALPRREALAKIGTPEKLTELETRAARLDLKFIELDGDVGVLANGAGLTMTTMDAVRHFGGSPANFMEIGGESYTKATPALELVLSNPRVKCLLVNFCGAFARTDVMVDGVIKAWLELKPTIPIFFTIHGTGEDEAIAMVKERLGITPFDLMDDAVKAAVASAKGTRT
jgi:succinyl-CoA synthetase beta subunit